MHHPGRMYVSQMPQNHNWYVPELQSKNYIQHSVQNLKWRLGGCSSTPRESHHPSFKSTLRSTLTFSQTHLESCPVNYVTRYLFQVLGMASDMTASS